MRPTRFISVERLEATARNALLNGYGRVASWRDTETLRRQVHLHCEMDCQHPFEYEMHARYSANVRKRVKPLTVVVHSRCRKCAACRKRRTMFWQARAVSEFKKAPMTLFGTLTIAPEYDAQFDALSRISLAEQGVDFDRLPPAEMFRERVRQGGLELTKFLKRLREGDANRDKPQFRYLLVAEAHNGAKTSDAKRGRPHWHILLHEQTKDARLVLRSEWARDPNDAVLSDRYGNPFPHNEAFLKRQWKLGFSTFALCRTPQAAGYLCKYLTKEDASVRVRASFKYGHTNENETNDRDDDLSGKAGLVRENLDAPPKEGGKLANSFVNDNVNERS